MFSPRSSARTQTIFQFPVSALHQSARTPQPTHTANSPFTAGHNGMGLRNFQGCSGGRIAMINAPVRPVDEQPSRINNPTPKHGLMASTFRGRKKLVCFYCNKRSDTQYDGLMTRWDCLRCDATNFLDENGEITDPPATEFEVPNNRQYALPRPDTPPTIQPSEDSPFCSKCLKNQHLFTASLAQYDVVLDTRDRDYRKKEIEYYKYRARLEKTYPQVCEDCEPKALGRMKAAVQTAKADWLRRTMEKTRAKKFQRTRNFTASDAIEFAGKSLWHAGLLGQLLWSVMALFAFVLYTYTGNGESLSGQTYAWLDSLSTFLTSPTWTKISLWCSILSLWWNPKFIQMNRGVVRHLQGFKEWYKIQTLMIVSRSVFYYISGTGVLSDPFSQPTIASHLVMLVYILFLARKAKGSLVINMTPLWQSTPERLVNVGPRSAKSPQSSNDLGDILDEISGAGKSYSSLTPSPSPKYPLQRSSNSPYDTPVRAPLALNNRVAPGFERSNTTSRTPLVLNNRPASPFNRAGTTNYMAASTPHAQPQYNTGDEMDWSPVTNEQPKSEHRAFKPLVNGNATRFGHSPVEEHSSPFWFKIPPAPTTPAQRLRNPPNQARFCAPTQEVKENFFNNVARRNSDEFNPKPRHDIQMQQPKFFPPTAPDAGEDALVDCLTGFTLGSEDPKPQPLPSKPVGWNHLGQAFVLILGLLFWNYALLYPDEHTKKVLLAVMTGCIAIGARTIIDNTKLAPQMKNSRRVFGMALGGLACLGAIYGIVEILAGRGETANSRSLGTMLLGAMLSQQGLDMLL